jgi:hypothetical protein
LYRGPRSPEIPVVLVAPSVDRRVGCAQVQHREQERAVNDVDAVGRVGNQVPGDAVPQQGWTAGTLPEERDVRLLDGPQSIEILARVAARLGESDRAIAALQKLLSIPYWAPLASHVPLTPALLRLDPMFDPLRNNPRFQELCRDKQP